MTLLERLAQLPDTALVPVAWVRELVAAANGAPGSTRGDDRALSLHRDADAVSTSDESGDRLLHAKEVAARLGCSVRYIYAKADTFPFTKRLGSMVRFSEAGLTRWLARRVA